VELERGGSERRAALAGALILASAAWLVLRQLPTPPPTERAPEAAPVRSAGARVESRRPLSRVGPLVVGDEIAPGVAITKLELGADSIRVHLARAGQRPLAIDVSPKRDSRERPPPIEFPNIELRWVGRGKAPGEYASVARALWQRLDAAARPGSPSERLPEWKRAAVDGR
jgi:hypothetical protein